MAGAVTALRGSLEAAGLSGLALDAVSGAIIAFAVLAVVPAFGFLVDRARWYVSKAVASAFGQKAAFFLMNYATFPGVITHELSHALVAKLSGCRINSIKLFEPSGSTLGSVQFTCQGSKRRQSFQMAASSCAPVLCGMALTPAIWRFAGMFHGAVLQAMLFHFSVSVACHMTMSRMDMRSYRKGAIGLFLRLAPVCLCVSYAFGRGSFGG